MTASSLAITASSLVYGSERGSGKANYWRDAVANKYREGQMKRTFAKRVNVDLIFGCRTAPVRQLRILTGPRG
jgi:hypothetical protein